MGLFDKIKGFIGDPEIEDDFEEEQEEKISFHDPTYQSTIFIGIV